VNDRSVLYVNDRPDDYVGNGGDEHPHGHVYYVATKRPCVQVSFVAHDGTAMRVSFDPATGAVRVQDITEAPCNA
jgi:hypothetical protein